MKNKSSKSSSLSIGLTIAEAIKTGNKTRYDSGLLKQAVYRRDQALRQVVKAFEQAIVLAQTAKQLALSAAGNLSDRKQRRKATKQAWSEYKEARAAAFKARDQEQEETWRRFRLDKLACIISENLCVSPVRIG